MAPVAGDEPPVRIVFVEGRCQGHARCAFLAPEVFDLDADGYAFVQPGCEQIAIGDEPYEKALLAAENCPEEAIRIEPVPHPAS